MAKDKSLNKILSIILAIVIIVAVIVVIYANLTNDNTDNSILDNNQVDDNQVNNSDITISVTYGIETKTYKIKDIENLAIKNIIPRTGFGAKRTNGLKISSSGNYTGVLVTDLVEKFNEDITNYSIVIQENESGNVDTFTLNYTTAIGSVTIYNSTNATDELGTGSMKTIIAYKKDGEYLDPEDDGNLMVAFINPDNEYATPSYNWRKFVEAFEIVVD